MSNEILKSNVFVVTRPKELAEELAIKLQNLGGQVVIFPTIQTIAARNPQSLIEGVKVLHKADYAIFISPTAVRFAGEYIQSSSPKLPDTLKLIAQGIGTANALIALGWKNIVFPKQKFTSEALLELPELQDVNGKEVVIFGGEGGRKLLKATLEQRGAKVLKAIAYERCCPTTNPEILWQYYQHNHLNLIISTSGESLQNLVTILGSQGLSIFQQTPLLVVSERMVAIAKELGHKATILIEENVSNDAIVEAIVNWVVSTNNP